MIHLSMKQLDEINTIQVCLSAIADLMEPATDLHAVNRDSAAVLLGYFTEKLKSVMTEPTHLTIHVDARAAV
ncbi:MAG: hypothetical protein WCP96_18745 [Methylococcaceae bacterium]